MMRKLLLSLFIVFAIINISGCGKEEEEQKEPTTLTEYFVSLNRDVSQYEFKCTPLESNDVIYFDYNYTQSLMFLSDGKVLDVVNPGKSFSNGEQCKINDSFPTVKKVIPFVYEKYLITQDDKICKYSSRDGEVDCNLEAANVPGTIRNISLIKTKNNLLNVLGTSYYSEKSKKSTYGMDYFYVYYHLDSDNKIYKTTLNDKGKLVSSNEAFTVPNYGNIRFINAKLNLDENTMSLEKLITDTGYYELKEIKTEECTKYVDVECQKLFVKHEILDKYWNSIKYVSNELIFTNDGHAYSFYLLDK